MSCRLPERAKPQSSVFQLPPQGVIEELTPPDVGFHICLMKYGKTINLNENGQRVDANGNQVSETIDLAYSHIKKGKNAQCIGLALNLGCDPCVENLKWECPKF